MAEPSKADLQANFEPSEAARPLCDRHILTAGTCNTCAMRPVSCCVMDWQVCDQHPSRGP